MSERMFNENKEVVNEVNEQMNDSQVGCVLTEAGR